MLTNLDDSPWHQLPTTFDHVGSSDPRFFDRLWFAASAPDGSAALQFTIGVYQNMNVVDGGFVFIHRGRQHNLRASRRLRPLYETVCGPLRFTVPEPLQHIVLTVGPNPAGVTAELDWVATVAAQEERHHFARRTGRVIEDYSRYDQIGQLGGWVVVDGERIVLERWWACRDHSWGVRERVGIPEPDTGAPPGAGGSFFAFLFFSTDTHAGHLQASGRGPGAHVTTLVTDRADGSTITAEEMTVTARFVDDGRPRRVDTATFETVESGQRVTYEVARNGAAVAMPGLGYGGYDDGLGLGVFRGDEHVEHDVWDVTHPALVALEDGSTQRPVHRIQPVTVRRTDANGSSEGHGSLTLIDESPSPA